ncbi:predicted protein [Arabidopsis lyrata subsp. lyrata]|uniref:Predicted protein n=1 Tax=Arabidopsis lyrata subsp. lyrata TaxID=81972 RepID=D7LC21_ARALL|nr:predicted protein [Arabidopsis lyrata subsp. lyrata]
MHLISNLGGCISCYKYDGHKNARSMRKAIMLSKRWHRRQSQASTQLAASSSTGNKISPKEGRKVTPPRTLKYYDFRRKNAQTLRRAIILSKRLSKKHQGEASSSQKLTRQQRKQLQASMVQENPILQCPHCKALVWYSEKTGNDPSTGEPIFTICCQQGRVKLPPIKQPPPYLEYLHANSKTFRINIRIYNSILAFTSMGAQIDHSVTYATGPPVFRIHGQVFHRIGSLLPMPGQNPKFLQMYIIDTENEVSNRINTMSRRDSAAQLEEDIVAGLIEMLDEHNCLCMFFRKARDRFNGNNVE